MGDKKLLAPLSTLEWVDRKLLRPNDYNPNKVSKENLRLLTQSILTNGWTLPIVVRPDYTIIDGFHRWTVAGEEPLLSMLDGKVPVVKVFHEDASDDIYGTVTHNRARGTHHQHREAIPRWTPCWAFRLKLPRRTHRQFWQPQRLCSRLCSRHPTRCVP